MKELFEKDMRTEWIITGIVCASVALHQGTSFPVGKVEFMDLYPLSFTEFMRAIMNYLENSKVL